MIFRLTMTPRSCYLDAILSSFRDCQKLLSWTRPASLPDPAARRRLFPPSVGFPDEHHHSLCWSVCACACPGRAMWFCWPSSVKDKAMGKARGARRRSFPNRSMTSSWDACKRSRRLSGTHKNPTELECQVLISSEWWREQAKLHVESIGRFEMVVGSPGWKRMSSMP